MIVKIVHCGVKFTTLLIINVSLLLDSYCSIVYCLTNVGGNIYIHAASGFSVTLMTTVAPKCEERPMSKCHEWMCEGFMVK